MTGSMFIKFGKCTKSVPLPNCDEMHHLLTCYASPQVKMRVCYRWDIAQPVVLERRVPLPERALHPGRVAVRQPAGLPRRRRRAPPQVLRIQVQEIRRPHMSAYGFLWYRSIVLIIITAWHGRICKTSCWLRFRMFRHPAWAVGSYSSGPPTARTVRTK